MNYRQLQQALQTARNNGSALTVKNCWNAEGYITAFHRYLSRLAG